MVLAARPEGVSDEDVLKLARDVLTSEDVSEALESRGFDVSGWKSTKLAQREKRAIPAVAFDKVVEEDEETTPKPPNGIPSSLRFKEPTTGTGF